MVQGPFSTSLLAAGTVFLSTLSYEAARKSVERAYAPSGAPEAAVPSLAAEPLTIEVGVPTTTTTTSSSLWKG